MKLRVAIIAILSLFSSNSRSQSIYNCDSIHLTNQIFYIKGFSTSDTLDFGDIENGFELLSDDTSFHILRFTIGYGCEYNEKTVNGNRIMKPKWLAYVKDDNIFTIFCVIVQKEHFLVQLKPRLFYLRGLKPCYQ